MSQDSLATLIQMVNQIADNHRYHGSDEAAAEHVAIHLKKFWARSMKRQLIEGAGRDASQLSPVVKLAIKRLASHQSDC